MQFFIDKQLSPTISVYPAPDASSKYTVYMNVLTRMDDADSATNTLDIPFRFYPCLAAGLAYYLSIKKSPERTALLKQIYDEEFFRAMEQDEDRASVRITPDVSSLKKEWNKLKTCSECWESKHPQLTPTKNLIDPQAIREPRPDVSVVPSAFTVYTNHDLGIIGSVLTTPSAMTASLGTITITT